MSDRTSVYLTIPAALKEITENVIKKTADLDFDYVVNDATPEGNIDLYFDEVIDGQLEFLDNLVKAGVPFDSAWSADYCISAGKDSARFDSYGVLDRRVIYEYEENPNINRIKQLLGHPVELKAFLVQHIEGITLLPWDNQVEYGKRFLARNLIASTKTT